VGDGARVVMPVGVYVAVGTLVGAASGSAMAVVLEGTGLNLRASAVIVLTTTSAGASAGGLVSGMGVRNEQAATRGTIRVATTSAPTYGLCPHILSQK